MFSVSNDLPRTSYIKMVDVWLVLCQMVPFAEVILLTAMEYFREEEGLEQNGNMMVKVMDISNEECEVEEQGCSRTWIPQLKTLGYHFKSFAEYHTLLKSN